MKLTKSRLQQIIKEEIQHVLQEGPQSMEQLHARAQEITNKMPSENVTCIRKANQVIATLETSPMHLSTAAKQAQLVHRCDKGRTHYEWSQLANDIDWAADMFERTQRSQL